MIHLVERALAGDERAIARLATIVERQDELGRRVSRALYGHSGKAHLVGVTGPPGSGKSTLVNALIGRFRELGRRVGVIAIDPSSPFAGGAALGDRIRMLARFDDPGVFIRSMASRGYSGGLAPATHSLAHLLDAVGFDLILIETVGVGQGEIAIARATHTTVVVQVPGLGDHIQAMKAGLLDIADIVVVNKADLAGAANVARDLQREVTGIGRGGLNVPVMMVSAHDASGIAPLADAIADHPRLLEQDDLYENRIRQIAHAEIEEEMTRVVVNELCALPWDEPPSVELLSRVANRRTDPALAAAILLRRYRSKPSSPRSSPR